MPDQRRGNDAQEQAPQPKNKETSQTTDKKQDAANYEKRTDGGRAIEIEDVNSANDE